MILKSQKYIFMSYPKTPNFHMYEGDSDLLFRAKIKLHGTFASLFIDKTNSKIIPGKRRTPIGKHCGNHYNTRG
jgi:hypothetical protein